MDCGLGIDLEKGEKLLSQLAKGIIIILLLFST